MTRPGMLALLGALTVAGCVTSGESGPGASANPQGEVAPEELANRFVLGEGDIIEVKVFREPDLAGVYRVEREDSDFPLIGKVQLNGREAFQVGEEIRKRLADGNFIRSPQVTVFVREHGSRKVHVIGQVNKPGSYNYESGMSVIQAIANAGGLAKLAASNSVLVTRKDQHFTVPVGDIGSGRAPNFPLEPGDIIFVPEAIF